MKCLSGTLVVMALLLTACSGSSDSANSTNSNISDVDSYATCGSETFSGITMAAGSIYTQDNWSIDNTKGFDEAVTDLGSSACRGKGVWRISNLTTSTAFGDHPMSPALNKDSGESSIRTAGGGDTFETSFFFRSVSSVADGTTMTLSISPNGGDRNNYVRFENDDDADGGFWIYTVDGGGNQFTVANNITRGQWHKIRIVLKSVDGQNGNGSGNDVMKVYYDGPLVVTTSSWEEFFLSLPQAILPSNRVMFRVNNQASTVGSFTTPQGLYIDDFKQLVYDSSAPGTILSHYETGFEVP